MGKLSKAALSNAGKTPTSPSSSKGAKSQAGSTLGKLDRCASYGGPPSLASRAATNQCEPRCRKRVILGWEDARSSAMRARCAPRLIGPEKWDTPSERT